MSKEPLGMLILKRNMGIIDYYSRNFSAGADTSRLCLTYDEFVKRCSDLEKVTLSDIFALQLMQVTG